MTCGVGRRTRTRDCLSQTECEGDPVQYEECSLPSCDSEFSRTKSNGGRPNELNSLFFISLTSFPGMEHLVRME